MRNLCYNIDKELKAFEKVFGPIIILEDNNMSDTLYKDETIKEFGHKQTREDSWRWWVSCESGNIYSFFDGTDQQNKAKYVADLKEGDQVKIAYVERQVKDNLYYDLKGATEVARQVERAPEQQSERVVEQTTNGFSTTVRKDAICVAIEVFSTFDTEKMSNEDKLKTILALTSTYELYLRGGMLEDKVFNAEDENTEVPMEEKVPFDDDPDLAMKKK